MEYKKVDINKLKVLDKNPRTISEKELKKLEASIVADKDFLEVRPILVNVINGAYMVYGGAQRLTACKNLGFLTVPCAIEYDLPAKVMDFRMLADNKHAGEWDFTNIDASVFGIDTLKDAGIFSLMEKEQQKFLEENGTARRVSNLAVEGLGGTGANDGSTPQKQPKAEKKGTLAIALTFANETQMEQMTEFLGHLRQKYPNADGIDEKFLLFLLDWQADNQTSLAQNE